VYIERKAADLVQSRHLSPVELTRAVLEQIDRLNSRLNAYIRATMGLFTAATHIILSSSTWSGRRPISSPA